jgi:hypothetical protein
VDVFSQVASTVSGAVKVGVGVADAVGDGSAEGVVVADAVGVGVASDCGGERAITTTTMTATSATAIPAIAHRRLVDTRRD